MGIFFHQLKTLKKGGKRGEKALKSQIFNEIGKKRAPIDSKS